MTPVDLADQNRITAGPRRSSWSLLVPATAGFVLGLGLAISCYIYSGVSLGLFFGPIMLATFLVPPLTMSEASRSRRLLLCSSIVVGIWTVWLILANLSALDALRCGVALLAYVIALAGVASLLECVRLGKGFACAVTVFFAVLWLSWPIWLSPWLAGPHAQTAVAWLTAPHPLMAVNAILFDRFNFWDRYTLAYQQLTILNQDVLYTLPRSIAWMVLLHGAVGIGGFTVGDISARRTVA